MLKNIFDSDELIVCRPNPELLEHIKSHNMKIFGSAEILQDGIQA